MTSFLKASLLQKIESAIRNHKNQLFIEDDVTSEMVSETIQRIMRDNPDIFWFSLQWTLSNNHLLKLFYTLSPQKTEKVKKQIEDVIQNDFRIDYVRTLPKSQQLMYVYKWVGLYCRYNLYSAYNQTIYSVFVHRNSVCAGISKAAQYLFQLLGIESKLIYGNLQNSDRDSRHCWLLVNVDGKWHHCDPTFALPSTEEVLSSIVTPIPGADGLFYNFFSTDTETIEKTHTAEQETELPTCTTSIDWKELQHLEIHPSRNIGCLLSDSGATSNIYLFHSATQNESQAVLKVYEFKGNSIFRSDRLLQKEYYFMNSIHGNHVLKTLGVAKNNKGLLIEQATALSDLLSSNYYKLSSYTICQLLIDVLNGVKECLNCGVYYRDLHLKNIFRSIDGSYQLGDFGSCTKIGEEPDDIGGSGSPWYMAPETYATGEFDEKSATYGIAMIGYFLLNNLFPPLWHEHGKHALHLRLHNKAQLPVPELLKGTSSTFKQCFIPILQKALSFNRTDRYSSLNLLESDLYKAAQIAEEDDFIVFEGGNCKSNILDDNWTLSKSFQTQVSPVSFEATGSLPFHATVLHTTVAMPRHNTWERTSAPNACPPPRNRIDDFATTMVDVNSRSKTMDESYAPKVTPSKTSIWKKMFGQLTNKEQDVYSSVFAPSEIAKNSHLLIQVYLHTYEEAERVLDLAQEVQKNAVRRDYIPLQCRLKTGDTVDVKAHIYGHSLLFSEQKRIRWQGSFSKCTFSYIVPDEINVNELCCKITMEINGIAIGEMMFVTQIVKMPSNVHTEIISRRYDKIFISYAHQDESKVKYLAEAYRAQGANYFFDRHYLQPGDVFPVRIQEYIKSADLFILCWSENALKSEYVDKERKQALTLAYPHIKPMEKATLTIYPISIDPHAELPDDMRNIYNFEML